MAARDNRAPELDNVSKDLRPMRYAWDLKKQRDFATAKGTHFYKNDGREGHDDIHNCNPKGNIWSPLRQ